MTQQQDQPIPIGEARIFPFYTERPEEHDSILIFPGGGYSHVSLIKEGENIGRAFNSEGFNAFVTEYSVAPFPKEVILSDAENAVRRVRQLIRELRPGSGKLALMGFSAGGHLALMTAEHSLDPSISGKASDPDNGSADALILCYPVVTFRDPYAHKGSRTCFLGSDQEDLIGMYSAEEHVSRDLPQVFIWHCEEDRSVPIENSLMLRNALDRQGIDCHAVFYPGGAHGLGLAQDDEIIRGWFTECVKWLRGIGFA